VATRLTGYKFIVLVAAPPNIFSRRPCGTGGSLAEDSSSPSAGGLDDLGVDRPVDRNKKAAGVGGS
jgi:hypothetical protein